MLLNPYVGAISSKITHITIQKAGNGVVTQTSTMLAINRLWSKNENRSPKKSKTCSRRTITKLIKTIFAPPKLTKTVKSKMLEATCLIKGEGQSNTYFVFIYKIVIIITCSHAVLKIN